MPDKYISLSDPRAYQPHYAAAQDYTHVLFEANSQSVLALPKDNTGPTPKQISDFVNGHLTTGRPDFYLIGPKKHGADIDVLHDDPRTINAKLQPYMLDARQREERARAEMYAIKPPLQDAPKDQPEDGIAAIATMGGRLIRSIFSQRP